LECWLAGVSNFLRRLKSVDDKLDSKMRRRILYADVSFCQVLPQGAKKVFPAGC
jgi:hypothetical protein